MKFGLLQIFESIIGMLHRASVSSVRSRLRAYKTESRVSFSYRVAVTINHRERALPRNIWPEHTWGYTAARYIDRITAKCRTHKRNR